MHTVQYAALDFAFQQQDGAAYVAAGPVPRIPADCSWRFGRLHFTLLALLRLISYKLIQNISVTISFFAYNSADLTTADVVGAA